jgi:DNA topoisomerase-6 subunit B
VSSAIAAQMCKAAGATSRTRAGDVEAPQAEKLFQFFQEVKLPPPPTDCLAPIGVRQLLAGMLKGVRAEFYAASSRSAEVYRGRPFQIEAAIAFGGDLPAEEPARVIRFANRVPLLFQQSACSSFKAVLETGWKNYNLQQPRGSLPVGPLVIMLHMASVWVPFTSESKEAIADYDEIRKEMKLALMECGRKLGTYLNKRAKMRREGERRDVFARYIGEISKAIGAITGEDAKRLYDALHAQAKRKTAVADQQLDEDGKVLREQEDLDDDGVLVVPSAMTDAGADDPVATTAFVAPPARVKPKPPAAASTKPASRSAAPSPKPPSKSATKPAPATSPKLASPKAALPKPAAHKPPAPRRPSQDGPTLF